MPNATQAQSEASISGVFEASLAPNGAVMRGKKLTMKEAEEHRKKGYNVVVCGSDGKANRARAEQIERNANGNVAHHAPSATAGANALWHYQPDPRARWGIRFMSHRDGMRSRGFGNMRYFTPDLVRKLNAPNGETVDEVAERWEEAIQSYQKHLQRLRREMPSALQPVTNLSLHDWNVITITVDKHGAGRKAGSVLVALKDNGNLIFLRYSLTQKLRRIDSPEGWPFKHDAVDWLYDEVDADKRDEKSFVHRILFSDGTTLVIPFATCIVTRVKADRSISHSDLMQIA